jgi:hypothetical protein
MATRVAIATGAWSSPSTWSGGIIPGLGDDVNASGAGVSVDIPINVGSLFSSGGGYFQPTFACTSITCTGVGIDGTFFGGSGAFGLLNLNGAYSNLTINSNIIGGAFSNGFAVFIQGASTITFNGDIIGGTNASGYAVNNVAGGSLTFNGNLLGRIAPAVRNVLATTLNVTGSLRGGNATTGYALSNSGVGVTNITGAVTAGLANGFITTGTGLTTCIGVITASDSTYAISTAGTVRVSTPCINSFNFNAITQASYVAIYNSAQAVWSYRADNDTNTYKRIYSSGAAGNPIEANVRAGVTYGTGFTGTLEVPSQADVLASVPNDSGVGTYYKTAGDIVTEILTELLANPEFSTAGSFGKLVLDNLDSKSSDISKNTNLIPAVV